MSRFYGLVPRIQDIELRLGGLQNSVVKIKVIPILQESRVLSDFVRPRRFEHDVIIIRCM